MSCAKPGAWSRSWPSSTTREHCWKTLAAACVLPGDPDKDKKAGGKMTKAEVDASFEQIAADLRKRAPDLTL